MSDAGTFLEAARRVLDAERAPLPTQEIWNRAQSLGLVETEGKTPEATLYAVLLRASRGISVSKMSATRPFYKAGPGRFGLVAWLTPKEIQELDAEEGANSNGKLPSAKSAARAERRADPAAVRELLESLFPSSSERSDVLQLLARSIQRAHKHGAARWGVTLRRKSVHLNVGRLLCLGLYEGRIWLGADPKLLEPKTVEILRQRATPAEDGVFRSEPDIRIYNVPPDALKELLPHFESAYLAFLDRAANTAKRMPWSRSHSPGVVEYLEEELRIDLPEPEYGPTQQLSRLEEFEDLFQRFCDSYLQSAAGAQHLAKYPAARSTAAANMAEIRSAAAKEGAPTDLILLRLLPHLNSEGNRARGAWIHVAPAVTKDLKQWFEGAGWTRPDQWPAVAAAVLRFVERCVAHPEELADAVMEFAAHGFKGFQMGMLSPILNALSPAKFVLLNNKSREAINYFAETEFKPRLEEYPTANKAALELLQTTASILEAADSSALPCDLFDVFSHWLVAIEGHELREPRYWKI